MNRRPVPRYPLPKVVAVDVDGTLHSRGQLNERVVNYCKAKKLDGFFIMLWSLRGEAHAREMANALGVTDCFDLICSKPGLILDDNGWQWARFVPCVRDLNG